MKTIHSLILAGGMIALASCNANREGVEVRTPQADEARSPETADVIFKDRMTGKVFRNYLHLKMALVASDFAAASRAAGDLAESFTEEREQIKLVAYEIAEAEELSAQRQDFSRLSQAVEPLFSEGLKEGNIYKQYCPMAFNDTGAFWFSDVPQIENPYFGAEMLNCGTVQKTLTTGDKKVTRR